MLYDSDDAYDYDPEYGTERIEHYYWYAFGEIIGGGDDTTKFTMNFIHMKLIMELFVNFYIPQLEKEERLRNHFNEDDYIYINPGIIKKVKTSIDSNFFCYDQDQLNEYPYEENYWDFLRSNAIGILLNDKFFWDNEFDEFDDDDEFHDGDGDNSF